MSDVIPLEPRAFQLLALSLARGPNFDEGVEVISAWTAKGGIAFGAVLFSAAEGYSFLAMRRRIDHRFVEVGRQRGLPNVQAALDAMLHAMSPDAKPEPLKSGERRRPGLLDLGSRVPCATFELLAGTASHYAAMVAVGEIYLAMPRPDDNFVSDMQSTGFDARLWELYLVACFREQGVLVRQDQPSPDFRIEAGGAHAYVEAVVASSQQGRRVLPNAFRHAPEDKEERMAGAPAVRFAKTLRSKLQREYHEKAHVQGSPFAIAIADYHENGSMVWSREALPTYLYGRVAVVRDGPNGKYATGEDITHLRGDDKIPAGLFREPAMKALSAVIFSNSATLGKFNRMGLLGGFALPGIKMIRKGSIFDRTPGALEAVDFELDITSDEYAALWPGGEAWCQELEVFHNPNAEHPFAERLLPGAAHWFENDGEVECRAFWENSVLGSVTRVETPRELEEIVRQRRAGRA